MGPAVNTVNVIRLIKNMASVLFNKETSLATVVKSNSITWQ